MSIEEVLNVLWEVIGVIEVILCPLGCSRGH